MPNVPKLVYKSSIFSNNFLSSPDINDQAKIVEKAGDSNSIFNDFQFVSKESPRNEFKISQPTPVIQTGLRDQYQTEKSYKNLPNSKIEETNGNGQFQNEHEN